MRRLAVLSMHTSPLAQPGTGDGGGMNVYVRELSAALARSGVTCEVFTRKFSPELPDTIELEPGLFVHHVGAGPQEHLDKGQLHHFVDQFADGVEERLEKLSLEGGPVEAVHANYWLSGVAGHRLKHRLNLPLVSTFHTLDRVKAEESPEDADPVDPDRRSHAEAEVIGCSDAVLASCSVEVDQIVELYGAQRERVRVIAPGVDHAFFSPGDQAQARRALGLDGTRPLLLFVGRIQPLKGLDIAVRTLWHLDQLGIGGARLVVVGGPSGPLGEAQVVAIHDLVAGLGLSDRVIFVPPRGHELLATYYRAADVAIVPSRSESFGLVALEAAACGTPVVASAVGGLTSLVEHGRTGFLVDKDDEEGFAAAVARLWSQPQLSLEMGSAAALAARTYTWSIAAKALNELYDELTDQRVLAGCCC